MHADVFVGTCDINHVFFSVAAVSLVFVSSADLYKVGAVASAVKEKRCDEICNDIYIYICALRLQNKNMYIRDWKRFMWRDIVDKVIRK